MGQQTPATTEQAVITAATLTSCCVLEQAAVRLAKYLLDQCHQQFATALQSEVARHSECEVAVPVSMRAGSSSAHAPQQILRLHINISVKSHCLTGGCPCLSNSPASPAVLHV